MNENFVNYDGLTIKLNNDDFTAKIINSYGKDEKVIIPHSILHESQEYLITEIDPYCFRNNRKIKSLAFANDSEVKYIEKSSFSGSNIESLLIPSSIEELKKGWCRSTSQLTRICISPRNKFYYYLDESLIIGKSKIDNTNDFDTIYFARRDIEKVSIPSFIKYISSNSFSECKQLKTIEFSQNSNLLAIFNNAFALSSIESIFIPEKVELLKDGWCKYTAKLKTVFISPINPNYRFLDADKKIIIDKSNILVFACRDITKAVIPSSITRISSGAFSECKWLDNVEIPKDSQLISIGKNAFFRTSIKTFFIPHLIERIENCAFMNCNELKSVIFDDDSKIELIGDSAFSGSSIVDISIPSHVKKIGRFALSDCSYLSRVQFDENSELETICECAFSYSNLKNFIVPESVRTIEKFAFSKCFQLQTIDFSVNTELESIGEDVFALSSILYIKIPKKIKRIDDNAFFKCRYLKEIEISEDSELVSIGKNAFFGTFIDYLFIPSNIRSLGMNWCCYTPNLTNVDISSENENFKFIDDERKIIVGKSNLDVDVFDVLVFVVRDVFNVIIMPTIKYIASSAFSGCFNLKMIEFENESELTSIGENAFAGSMIQFISLPESVLVVYDQAFTSCADLQYIEFLSHEITISDSCLYNCVNLLFISFPNARKINFLKNCFSLLTNEISLFVHHSTEINHVDE